jgi:hypothetical protein
MCPSRWTIIVLTVALSAGLGLSLAAGAPTSAPAGDLPSISQAELASLKKLSSDSGPRHWGEAIIETFEKKPAKDAWTAGQNGQIEYKEGKMFLTAGGPNQMALVYRTLPENLRGSEAVRVEAWVQCRPSDMFRKGAAANNAALANRQMYQNVLFIGSDPNANLYQWDYTFHFANGINGQNQNFNQLGGGGIGRGGGGVQVQAGKLLHVTLELTSQSFRCQRADDDASKMEGALVTPFRVNDTMAVGFSCRSPGMTIVQMAYRGLAPVKAEVPADAWKNTAFANQDALTTLLLSRVVPALDDSHFTTRDQAHELLNSLWPLSKPAIDAVIKKGNMSAEASSRLNSLQSHAIKVEITKDANEKPITPPVTKDLPDEEKAASQPDKANAPAVQPMPAPLPAVRVINKMQVLPAN